VLDNISGIKESDIDYFDYDQLKQDFSCPLNLRKVDIRKYHIFGFLFVETTKASEKELNKILTSTLIDYIKIKDTVGNQA
jgi:hypothetical protein